MKAIHPVLAVGLVLGTALWIWTHSRSTPAPSRPVAAAVHLSVTEEEVDVRTNDDAHEVFRRAFWREPARDDRILHGERREWVDLQNHVRLWQWFLAVKPGAEFTTWMQERNPFRLVERDALARPVNPDKRPNWFPPDHELAKCEVRQAVIGNLTVYRDHDSGMLYATDAGRGFGIARGSRSPVKERQSVAGLEEDPLPPLGRPRRLAVDVLPQHN